MSSLSFAQWSPLWLGPPSILAFQVPPAQAHPKGISLISGQPSSSNIANIAPAWGPEKIPLSWAHIRNIAVISFTSSRRPKAYICNHLVHCSSVFKTFWSRLYPSPRDPCGSTSSWACTARGTGTPGENWQEWLRAWDVELRRPKDQQKLGSYVATPCKARGAFLQGAGNIKTKFLGHIIHTFYVCVNIYICVYMDGRCGNVSGQHRARTSSKKVSDSYGDGERSVGKSSLCLGSCETGQSVACGFREVGLQGLGIQPGLGATSSK